MGLHIKKTAKFDSRTLAKLAGVTRGTVDRALHNRPEMSAVTKEKILRLAEKYHYRPNPLGRALVTGKTNAIGVIVFDLENSFFTEIVSAIERSLRNATYRMLLALSQKDPAIELQCIQTFAQSHVDGLILIPVGQGKPFEKCLKQLAAPVVVFGNRLSPGFPHVGLNEQAAMADAVKYLCDRGYCRIIYYCPPMRHAGTVNLWAQEQRFAGFVSAAQKNHVSYETIIEEGEMKKRLDANGFAQKTALLCSNDIYAVECLRHFAPEKSPLPRNLGIMGYDNLSMLDYLRPRPASVANPSREIGEAAAAILLKKIQGQKVSDHIVQHAIIPGETL